MLKTRFADLSRADMRDDVAAAGTSAAGCQRHRCEAGGADHVGKACVAHRAHNLTPAGTNGGRVSNNLTSRESRHVAAHADTRKYSAGQEMAILDDVADARIEESETRIDRADNIGEY